MVSAPSQVVVGDFSHQQQHGFFAEIVPKTASYKVSGDFWRELGVHAQRLRCRPFGDASPSFK